MDRMATLDEETLSMVFSDLTSLESGTDDFGRRILQHTRDTQRISNVLNSQPQAFRKARPVQRIAPVALTTDNLQRNSNANDALAAGHAAFQRHTPPSVASSTSSDPPLNVPRKWGRKGRHDHNWLKRIPRVDSRLKLEDDGTDQNGHVDWLAAANTPSASGGHDESPYRPSSRKSAAKPVQSPPQQIMEWDIDQDLTAASLLASTPALPSRNRQAIEDIRRRELENSSVGNISHNSTGLWERTPSEIRRRRSRENLQHAQPPQQSPPRDTTTYRSSPNRKTNGWNKENDPLISARIDNRPSLLDSYKSIESAASAGPAYASTTARDAQSPRQNQKRTDSMALLKRLARASQSPSPNSVKLSDNAGLNQDATKTPSGAPKHEPASQSQVSQNHVTPQIQPRTSRNIELPAQTPVVTGAWVDTPRTVKREDLADPTTMAGRASSSLRRRRSEPSLPTSALSAILENLRRDKANHTDDDPTLGDSTIASLEGLLHPTLDRGEADPTISLDIPDTLLSQADQDDNTLDIHPTTQADRDRRQEDLALEALNNMLGSTKASIHAASQGLKRAVRKVRNPITDSTIFEVPAPSSLEPTTSTTVYGHRHGHTSVFKAAWCEICSLFVDRSTRRGGGGWRLTWLGLAVVLFWTWLATETSLCGMYCHPTYATSMKGYGVDPNAPRFPFVLPTLVFRPFEEIWRPVVGVLASLMGSFWTFMMAEDGVVAPVRAPVMRMATTSGVGRDNGGLASGIVSKISWFGFGKSKGVAHDEDVWAKGQVRRMNVWDQGQVAWEAPGEGVLDGESMLEDEFV